jgi:hypothetical protein
MADDVESFCDLIGFNQYLITCHSLSHQDESCFEATTSNQAMNIIVGVEHRIDCNY